MSQLLVYVNKPLKTLHREFPSPKSRPPLDLQPNVVYKIPCANCATGRPPSVRVVCLLSELCSTSTVRTEGGPPVH